MSSNRHRQHVEQLLDDEMARRPGRGFGRAAELFVDVTLRGACRGRRCPEVQGKAKLDTGAAHTFITPEAVRKLGLRRLGSGSIRGIAGGKKPIRLPKHAVTMTFPEIGLQVPLSKRGAYTKTQKGRVALIGRDTMAGGDGKVGMRLEYDGPSGQRKLSKSKRSK
jgi:hypothetical protein